MEIKEVFQDFDTQFDYEYSVKESLAELDEIEKDFSSFADMIKHKDKIGCTYHTLTTDITHGYNIAVVLGSPEDCDGLYVKVAMQSCNSYMSCNYDIDWPFVYKKDGDVCDLELAVNNTDDFKNAIKWFKKEIPDLLETYYREVENYE